MPSTLLVITPSRGRPKSIARLLDSIDATAKIATHLHVCVDEDDETLPDYQRVFEIAGRDGDVLETGPRNGLCGWTNKIGVRRAAEYDFLASFGDDMVPRTPGWDFLLTRGITDMGGTGLVYPWDGTREDIPEAVVMSSDIVTALGWMCLPGLEHWFVDDAWGELGRRAGCLRHLRAVHVEHLHPGLGVTPFDKTNADSGKSLAEDRRVYREWRRTRMQEDAETIIRLRERALQPA